MFTYFKNIFLISLLFISCRNFAYETPVEGENNQENRMNESLVVSENNQENKNVETPLLNENLQMEKLVSIRFPLKYFVTNNQMPFLINGVVGNNIDSVKLLLFKKTNDGLVKLMESNLKVNDGKYSMEAPNKLEDGAYLIRVMNNSKMVQRTFTVDSNVPTLRVNELNNYYEENNKEIMLSGISTVGCEITVKVNKKVVTKLNAQDSQWSVNLENNFGKGEHRLTVTAVNTTTNKKAIYSTILTVK